MPTRRRLLQGAATAALSIALTLTLSPEAARAQANDILLTLIAPLSGGWARQGDLMKKGADLAVEDINAAGGVKLPGGNAKIRLIVADAGDTAEKAKNAAQRVLADNPNLTGGTGAWLSSFTLAITEVTERADVPWLTLSFADTITGRGFKNVFQTSATAGAMAGMTLDMVLELAKSATGETPKKSGFLADNTAAPTGFLKPLRDELLKAKGIEVVVDEIFTPPLADATPPVQRVRSTRPDMLFVYPTATPDVKAVLEKLKEFNLDRGRLPLIGNGAQFGTPEILNLVGKDLLEGFMFTIANWGVKGQEELINRFKQKTGEPWMTQDSISTYADMLVFKMAIEKAGSADKMKVAQALREIDTTDGVAKLYAGGRLKFDDKGRRVGASLYTIQWQGGEPKAVFPPTAAQAQPIWPKR
ncbi:MAG: branched-chain amino acid ABC transporter substrate-binding protein [Alphaproteobacteria bacterium]|nr:branched-chain amino acid ABC transporter substrate-binding protein [Alphaproteobacteria bacterium]